MRVLVVGAGVTGLTVGVRLAEAGYDVHVLARELPLETTSAMAAALWYPYLAFPVERVGPWSEHSLREFTALADGDENCGVEMRDGVELLLHPSETPPWAAAVQNWKRLDFPPAPYRDGWSSTLPVIEMPLYLAWLQKRLESAGGTVTRMALAALPDHADLVVNCSGLGARLLGADTDVTPSAARSSGWSRWGWNGGSSTSLP
jgi:D-amino-acid oxidase